MRADAGYTGACKREEDKDLDVSWETAMKPGKRRLLGKSGPEEAAETRKAGVGEGGAPVRYPKHA